MQDIVQILVEAGASKVVQFGSSLWRSIYNDIDIFAEMEGCEEVRRTIREKNGKIDLHFGGSWERYREGMGINKYLVLYTNQKEAQCL